MEDKVRGILKISSLSDAVLLVLGCAFQMDPRGRAGALREPRTRSSGARCSNTRPDMSDDVTLVREAGGSHKVALQGPLSQGSFFLHYLDFFSSHSNCDP